MILARLCCSVVHLSCFGLQSLLPTRVSLLQVSPTRHRIRHMGAAGSEHSNCDSICSHAHLLWLGSADARRILLPVVDECRRGLAPKPGSLRELVNPNNCRAQTTISHRRLCRNFHMARQSISEKRVFGLVFPIGYRQEA